MRTKGAAWKAVVADLAEHGLGAAELERLVSALMAGEFDSSPLCGDPDRILVRLRMRDGTQAHFALFENGYAALDSLYGCRIKLPDEVFAPVYAAAKASLERESFASPMSCY